LNKKETEKEGASKEKGIKNIKIKKQRQIARA